MLGILDMDPFQHFARMLAEALSVQINLRNVIVAVKMKVLILTDNDFSGSRENFERVFASMPIVLLLEKRMAERRMSLNELASLVGITNVNLSRLKTSKVKAIRFTTMDALCSVLGCQPGDLLVHIDSSAYADLLEEAARMGKPAYVLVGAGEKSDALAVT